MLDESEIRAIARDEFKKLLANGIGEIDKSTKNTSIPQYLPTSEAWEILGYKSRKQLIGVIKSGDLREGKEYQDRSSKHSQKPIYYFNIKACIKRLNIPRDKRN